MGNLEQARHYFEMGLLLLQDNDYRNAIDLLSTAISLDSDFGEAYGFRGFAYFNLGMYEEAMTDYDLALYLDLSSDKILYFRATLHLELKHYQEAIEDYTSAIELHKSFADAYYHRGICKGILGDTKGATYDIIAAAQLGMRLAQKILNEKGIVW
jgi:tetratricopeptide (TPR) repeat protein